MNKCQSRSACLHVSVCEFEFFKDWTAGSQFTIVGDAHNSSQGRRVFASKSILLVPLGVVSGLASPGRQSVQQRESWISQQNFWGQPGRQGVRGTDTNQKEVEGKAGEWEEDPTGPRQGFHRRNSMASANSLWWDMAAGLLEVVLSNPELPFASCYVL